MKKQMLENNEQIITFEQIIAGALLWFQTLDNIDISLLLEQSNEIAGIKVDACYIIRNLREYINSYYKDDSISL